jgi:glycine cleavage system pyridoxal-binding protein P
MTYVCLTDADREAMLETIGVSSVEELFRDIPEGVRLDRPLDLGEPLTDHAIVRRLEALAARNPPAGAETSFLGAGVYDHYVPAIVDAPETVNEDPYGAGWLIRIRLTDPGESDELLEAEAYKELLSD